MVIILSAAQLDWYNRGIVLLMSVMRGRADHGQAERAVYDDWRKDGALLEGLNRVQATAERNEAHE